MANETINGRMVQDANGEVIYHASSIRAEDGADTPKVSPITLTVSTTATRARSSNVATVTTGAAHGIAVGDTFTISGVTGSPYNGIFTAVTGTTGTTLVYASTGDDESAQGDTGGTVVPHLTLIPEANGADTYVEIGTTAKLRIAENNDFSGGATGKGYAYLGADEKNSYECADGEAIYIRPDAATAVVDFLFRKIIAAP